MLGPAVRWIGSPNYTPNRAGHNPDWTPADPNTWIVLHTMVGWIAGTRSAFLSVARQASSNYGVALDGSRDQYVKESDGPWTNGTMQGIGSNLDSITIECEDGGDYNGPRTPQLYQSLAQLVADIATRHHIPLVHRRVGGGVIGHHECDGSSTACPDSLDVDRVVREAIEYQAGRDPYASAPPLSGGSTSTVAPAVTLVIPAKPIPGVVFDTPDNDRSYLIYASNTFDMGNVADIGTQVTWTEAKWTADHGWILKLADGVHALEDGCVDDSIQGDADGHPGKYAPTDFAPPAPVVDTRPEWQRTLTVLAAPQVFDLKANVPIFRMADAALVGGVNVGPLTVTHQATSNGVPYWVTDYGATKGNGLRMADVTAALAQPVQPPAIDPLSGTGGSTASGGGTVVVVPPNAPPADVPPGFWDYLQRFFSWLLGRKPST